MSDTHEPPTACDAVTEALGDRYEVLTDLGEGSFGTVYKAKDKFLNRIVAVKSMRLDSAVDAATRAELNKRFLREAQVAAQLNHPNIVTIHDIISKPSASLIVMEFVAGVSLRSVLSSRKRLGLSETIDILSQVAEALDYAHERKVIHRDVKPANIMIMPSDDVRVTDFGIAKTESSSDLTLGGAILGTPDYMSPEQARGTPVDGRSDLFSLAGVLYECLVGEKPFTGATVTAVLLRIVSDDPVPDVDWAGLGLPAKLDMVMKRALAKDRSERYPTGAALIQDLQSLQPVAEPSKLAATEGTDKEPVPPSKRTEVAGSRSADDDARSDASAESVQPRSTSTPSYIESLRAEERYLCFSTEDPSALQALNLSPDEAYIVSRIDGTMKPRDIFAVSPLNENETARTILGLIEARVIKFRGKDSLSAVARKAHSTESQKDERGDGAETKDVSTEREDPQSRPGKPRRSPVNTPSVDPSTDSTTKEIDRLYDLARFQDHFQFLGVPKNADREAIGRAFQEKTVRYNSNQYPHIDDPDFHGKLRQLLKLAYEAYAALSKEVGKVKTPGRAGKEEAGSVPPTPPHRESTEEIYIRAEKAYENQDYWTTIELCRHAISVSEKDARLHYLLGLALLQNENWKKEAEESLRRATELDPNNPEYLEFLGSVYQQAGLSSRAQRMFDKAKSNQKVIRKQ